MIQNMNFPSPVDSQKTESAVLLKAKQKGVGAKHQKGIIKTNQVQLKSRIYFLVNSECVLKVGTSGHFSG